MSRTGPSDAAGGVSSQRVRGRIPAVIAYGLGLAAALVVLFAPLVQTVSTMSATAESGPGGEITVSSTRATTSLLESEGLSVLFLVAIPVVVIGAGLAAVLHGWARMAAVCTTLLWTFVLLLGYFSVGLFFAPSAVALVVATARMPRSQPPVDRRPAAR